MKYTYNTIKKHTVLLQSIYYLIYITLNCGKMDLDEFLRMSQFFGGIIRYYLIEQVTQCLVQEHYESLIVHQCRD